MVFAPDVLIPTSTLHPMRTPIRTRWLTNRPLLALTSTFNNTKVEDGSSLSQCFWPGHPREDW